MDNIDRSSPTLRLNNYMKKDDGRDIPRCYICFRHVASFFAEISQTHEHSRKFLCTAKCFLRYSNRTQNDITELMDKSKKEAETNINSPANASLKKHELKVIIPSEKHNN
jgi:hypothetical protein